MKILDVSTDLEAISILDDFIKENCAQNSVVLEAGCGSASRIPKLSSLEIHGIDISKAQLDRNVNLSKKFLGDIHNFKFEHKYNIIVSYYVFEHLSDPSKALANLTSALITNGQIILVLPNVMSLKGLVTKLTPHWFHIFYYRYILGSRDAGKNDTSPFPTTLRMCMAAQNLPFVAAQNGLLAQALIFHGNSRKYITKSPILSLLFFYVNKLMVFLSLGKLSEKSEMVFIAKLKKP
jgi:SAM-dependent methyltransferase